MTVTPGSTGGAVSNEFKCRTCGSKTPAIGVIWKARGKPDTQGPFCAEACASAYAEAGASSPMWKKGEGVKHDTNKTPLELLPFESVWEVAKVLEFGRNKYDAHNWRKGMKWSRLLGAALRHLFVWGRGEDRDPESGLSHLAHAACCVLFLLSYEQVDAGSDDRYKGK